MTEKDRLQIEVEKLRAELRGRPRRVPLKEQHAVQATIDAQTLREWDAAGFSISRRDCAGYGMSDRRWRRAYKVLRKWVRLGQ